MWERKGRKDVERPKSLRKAIFDFEWEVTLDKANWQEKYVVFIFSKKVIFTKMDKLHRWIYGRDAAWEK
jgi:translation initiation factor IF-2